MTKGFIYWTVECCHYQQFNLYINSFLCSALAHSHSWQHTETESLIYLISHRSSLLWHRHTAASSGRPRIFSEWEWESSQHQSNQKNPPFCLSYLNYLIHAKKPQNTNTSGCKGSFIKIQHYLFGHFNTSFNIFNVNLRDNIMSAYNTYQLQWYQITESNSNMICQLYLLFRRFNERRSIVLIKKHQIELLLLEVW